MIEFTTLEDRTIRLDRVTDKVTVKVTDPYYKK